MPRTLIKAFSADITVAAGERAVSAYISTAAVDRDGDVMVPQGCNSKDFQANPVVYLNHNYWDLPIGRCAAISREDDGITAKTVFAERPKNHPAGEEWVPDTLFDLFQQGILKGFSVGFEIVEARPATARDIERYGDGCRRVISKWRMYEYSVAPLPCNQEALSLAVSKGVVGPKMAKGVFNLTKKDDTATDDQMAKCSVCGKEFPADDMDEVDGKPVCDGCQDDDVEESKSAPAATKRVVHVVEGLAPAAAAPPTVKRVCLVINPTATVPPAAPDPATVVKRLVVANLAKRRGQLYAPQT